MLHNDISNRGGKTVAIRVDNCLLKYKDEGFIDKTLNLIKGMHERAEIDYEMLRRITFLYKKTDFNVALVVAEEYSKGIDDFLAKEGIPFSELHITKKPVDIAVKLNTEEFYYYVDTDEERLHKIGATCCINTTMFDMIFRGR